MALLDTSVAIYLRDANAEVLDRVAHLPTSPALSIMTCVELEGGMALDVGLAASRRIAVDTLTRTIAVIPVDEDIVRVYGHIVVIRGFSRRCIIDRLIAATAIVHGLTLVTINAADFRDIPGLTLETWPAPTQ